MSLQEKRIAELLLKYLFRAISPEERRELMEGYVELSPENRRKFDELTNPEKLGRLMHDYYEFESSLNGWGAPGPDDPEPPAFPLGDYK